MAQPGSPKTTTNTTTKTTTTLPSSAQALDPAQQAAIDKALGATTKTPLGVPKGYQAKQPGSFNIGGATGDVDRGYVEPAPVSPQYFQGDELYPAGWAPPDILTLQNKLKDSGLLPKGYTARGVWDQVSQDAMSRIMGYANASGVTKEDIIQRWTQQVPADDQTQGHVLTLKNPDDIKGVLQDSAAKIIGRSLTPAELSTLRAGYSNLDRRAQEEKAAATNVASLATDGTNQPVYEAPSVAQFAQDKLRQNFKGEADYVTANKRMHEFYSILGEGAGMSSGAVTNG